MEGRVRWFFGLARNAGAYSFPIIGTPCDVPEPKKTSSKGIWLFCYALRPDRWQIPPKITAPRHGSGALKLAPPQAGCNFLFAQGQWKRHSAPDRSAC